MTDHARLGAEVVTYDLQTKELTLNTLWWSGGTAATGPVGKLIKTEGRIVFRRRRREVMANKISLLPTTDNLTLLKELLFKQGNYAASRRLRNLFPDIFSRGNDNPIRLPSQTGRNRS